MKCVCCQGQFVRLRSDSFYSAFLATTEPYSEAAANSVISVHGRSNCAV